MTAHPRAFITKRDQFSSIWLKYVRGVDLSEHCLMSLIGERQPGVSNIAVRQELDLTAHPIPLAYYLCGVAVPYELHRNAHLAFVAAEGEVWEGEALVPGLHVRLEDAAPIFGWGEHSIDAADPNAGNRWYRTCRNWQFAHEAATRLNLTSQKNPDKQRWGNRRNNRRPAQGRLL